MKNTTLGVKLDDVTRERIRHAAQRLDRTPHWLIKQAIFSYLEQLDTQNQLATNTASPNTENCDGDKTLMMPSTQDENIPFLDFAENILPQSILRAAITAAYRRPETEILPELLEQARLPADCALATQALAHQLATQLRDQKTIQGRAGLVQSLLQEFSLSSQEGVALMCLAEALLRIPDKATRDALIRDKIGHGNWQAHLGNSTSLFVNAATWGLLLTGKLVATHHETSLRHTLNRMISKSGEPLIRKGIDMAMRLMGEQFVMGETISSALANGVTLEKKGFSYSYDMLGEAALTEADAQRYLLAYQQAIHAIGKASDGRGIYQGPGISIKLSALHPRYNRANYERVINELYPRLLSLTLLAHHYDIGLNIDAEEADRLEISLDLLEKLCFEPQLNGWHGIGFVIQAYQKRCPRVIDYLVDLARRSHRRLMIRLVKGAYWDSEIKRAQLDGLEDYPVYTRKTYTDIAYLACARKLLAVPDLIYPQFATHNAQTLSAIYHLAGQDYYPGQYEFQCLHGMGEPLYEQVVGDAEQGKLGRPCRIYAPVGTHETLLAYLVRRLLENGANTSFVNRIADPRLSLDELVADPIHTAEILARKEGQTGLSNPHIPLPRALYGDQRLNAAGLDLSNEQRLASLSATLLQQGSTTYQAEPLINGTLEQGELFPIINPADVRDTVGYVREATSSEVTQAINDATTGAEVWFATPVRQRTDILLRTADMMEAELPSLLALLIREAGKTFNNAIAEVRETVDFLRYYATSSARDFTNETHRPLGVVVCISPWNFPLAIFSGQIAATLAAGNSVLAKPAEQTPLIAARAIELFYQAGIPRHVLQLLPGRGESVGAQLVQSPAVQGVMFTGSTAVATLLQLTLAQRVNAQGQSIPLIAETGGLNAMLVDSSALTEQVVNDVMASAFDSAGQRCSALRILCLQEEIADHTLTMLRGAMAEYRMGNPQRLSTDMGPVIDAEAKAMIEQHISNMAIKGRKIHQTTKSHALDTADQIYGLYVPPTLIELDSIDELQQEIFGPVLHVVRYSRAQLPEIIAQINATGYGLTMGLHTRIDETIEQVTQQIDAGNQYVNRNMVGAVVGVQPFGGEGLSGTGPKAGGPLYLYRLLNNAPLSAIDQTLASLTVQESSSLVSPHSDTQEAITVFERWIEQQANPQLEHCYNAIQQRCYAGLSYLLDGPTGEQNSYHLQPRKCVLCLADNEQDAMTQLISVILNGSTLLWPELELTRQIYARLPEKVQAKILFCQDWASESAPYFDAVIHHGDSDQLLKINQQLAQHKTHILSVQSLTRGSDAIRMERLLIERSLSINTAAAGGNASLMTIG